MRIEDHPAYVFGYQLAKQAGLIPDGLKGVASETLESVIKRMIGEEVAAAAKQTVRPTAGAILKDAIKAPFKPRNLMTTAGAGVMGYNAVNAARGLTTGGTPVTAAAAGGTPSQDALNASGSSSSLLPAAAITGGGLLAAGLMGSGSTSTNDE